jgi:hypothetical protein
MNLQAYRNEVWSIMHGSDDPTRETAFVRLYLDESGNGSPATPHAVVAGILTNKNGFEAFEKYWAAILAKHRISFPIHMKEFGPHGCFASLSSESRKLLFGDLTRVIDTYRLFTISASLSNDEFKAHITPDVRKVFGVYGMCFNLAVMTAQKKAEADSYNERISFIMDSGNPYKHHVLGAYASMLEMQKKEKFLRVGSLTFEDDANLGILQGADVVAWATRRRLAGLPFGPFEPVQHLFKVAHIESVWTPELLKMLGENLSKQIAENKAAEAKNEEQRSSEF